MEEQIYELKDMVQAVIDRGATYTLALLGLLVMVLLLTWNQFRLASDEHRFNARQAHFEDSITCFVVQSFGRNDPARPESSPAGPSILDTCHFR